MRSALELKSCLRQKIVGKWTASTAYKAIDKQISNRFRKRLENDDFTILCSNCIGGVIYHRLGKRFLSPTINLFLSQPDFVSFCVNLDYYLGKSLVFIESEEEYPVAQLQGDGQEIPTITIFFNHDKEEEKAREDWENRKVRIHRDNLFIILYNLDGVTIDQLQRLEQVQCRNKIVLTATPLPELKWSYYIKPDLHHQYPYSYLSKNLFGKRYYERKFDFVAFLNSYDGKKLIN